MVIDKIPGVPDGIRVDEKGNLWIAAKAVYDYSPDGKLLGEIAMAETPTNLAFGDARSRNAVRHHAQLVYRMRHRRERRGTILKPALSEISAAGRGRADFSRDSILLVERGREPLKGYWSLPGGLVETGERLEQPSSREVFEETGLRVRRAEHVRNFRAHHARCRRAAPNITTCWSTTCVKWWRGVCARVTTSAASNG